MLTAKTAAAEPPATTADDTELRPVRLLVPLERASAYYLSETATLLAADLGITRDTTDTELRSIARTLPGADQLAMVRRLRQGLNTPRDVDEARDWGYTVPVSKHENSDPTATWWWCYHPDQHETRTERSDRYLADERLVDIRGMAALLGRERTTIRDWKVATDFARDVIANRRDARTRAMERFRKDNPNYPGDDTALLSLLLSKARKDVDKGTPLPFGRAGQSDFFTVASVLETGRLRKKLNQWFEYATVKQTGRPPGSTTRNWGRRRTTTGQ